MKNNALNDLFIKELEAMFNSEHQIIESLPKLINLVSLPELKEALSKHLKETQNQVKRIEKIFSLLNISPVETTCKGMEGLIQEAEDLVENAPKSPSLDATIITAAQKIEHYEIASYGTLKSFSKQLGFDEITDLIQDTLDEEAAADKKLTKIAEGSMFSSGVNKEAAETASFGQKKRVS